MRTHINLIYGFFLAHINSHAILSATLFRRDVIFYYGARETYKKT